MSDPAPNESSLDAEFRIGTKVIDMCERVAVAHKCAPGAVASWRLWIDDVAYRVLVNVEEVTDQ